MFLNYINSKSQTEFVKRRQNIKVVFGFQDKNPRPILGVPVELGGSFKKVLEFVENECDNGLWDPLFGHVLFKFYPLIMKC